MNEDALLAELVEFKQEEPDKNLLEISRPKRVPLLNVPSKADHQNLQRRQMATRRKYTSGLSPCS